MLSHVRSGFLFVVAASRITSNGGMFRRKDFLYGEKNLMHYKFWEFDMLLKFDF